jgi:hypothetical protein
MLGLICLTTHTLWNSADHRFDGQFSADYSSPQAAFWNLVAPVCKARPELSVNLCQQADAQIEPTGKRLPVPQDDLRPSGSSPKSMQ